MEDSFSTLHPIVNFTYFFSVITLSMLFFHPILLIISLFCGIAYSFYLNRWKTLKFFVFYLIPILVIVSIFNPVFNHQGMTILVYVNDNPITLESIVYGISFGFMFTSIIIWFSCFNVIMTSDKIIYLFSKTLPSLSLVFSMVLRFVPKFKKQIKAISNAQKCIGKDVSDGNFVVRIKNGMNIISILTTWALENSVDTVDSMKARGFGEKKRTAFSNFRFDNRDKTIFFVMLIFIIIIMLCLIKGAGSILFFPVIKMNQSIFENIILYTFYFLLLIFPVLFNFMEDIKWYLLKSKI